jgi:hypothetical protein
LDQGHEHRDDNAGNKQAIEQHESRRGELGRALLQLERSRVERFMPAREGAQKTAAAAQRVGEAPAKFFRVIDSPDGLRQLDTVLQERARLAGAAKTGDVRR